MAVGIANQAKNPTDVLPGLLTFTMDPEKGPNLQTWTIKPYQEWFPDNARNVETYKIAFTNTSVGFIVGGAAGYVVDYFADLVPTVKKIKDSVLSAVAVGTAIGGTVGAIRSIILINAFYLERPIVINSTVEAATKAKKIIEAFVESQFDSNSSIEEIRCPVSLEIMIYPVDIKCGSHIPHTFEYFSILNWLATHSTCPLCNRAVQIKNLDHNKAIEAKIHETATDIFIKMEAILECLPKRFYGLSVLPNFSESGNIEALAKIVKQGKIFLEGDINEVAKKVKNPDLLSLEETFALGYFLIHQFKPLKNKINQVYAYSGDYLRKLYMDARIDKRVYDIQLQQLEKWYATFDIIPEECKIIRKLYQL